MPVNMLIDFINSYVYHIRRLCYSMIEDLWPGCHPVLLKDINRDILKDDWIYFRPLGLYHHTPASHDWAARIFYIYWYAKEYAQAYNDEACKDFDSPEQYIRGVMGNSEHDSCLDNLIIETPSAYRSRMMGPGSQAICGDNTMLTRNEITILGQFYNLTPLSKFIGVDPCEVKNMVASPPIKKRKTKRLEG